MPALITEWPGGERYEYVPLGKYVVRAPDVCGGRPTFKHTRIEITGALERLAAGESIEEIVGGYEGRVSLAAMEEAVAITRQQAGYAEVEALRTMEGMDLSDPKVMAGAWRK